MFTHKRQGYVDHQHETVEEARLCERGFRSESSVPLGGGSTRKVQHQNPCVCGPYNRCMDVRVATARTHRDIFRSYCD